MNDQQEEVNSKKRFRFKLSHEEREKKRRLHFEGVKKGIFIFPTFITLANFSLGFMSIIYSLEKLFISASYLIIIAMIADLMDGAIARMTRTESKFGAQLDSLADVVSFGCAPAILLYQRFGLSAHPLWIFPLFYAIAGALRLARYNVIDSETGAKDFRGTPIPAPAGVIAGLVLGLEKLKGNLSPFVVIVLVFLLSYLMVSNIRYPHFRAILKPERPHPFRSLVIMLLVVVLLLTHFVGTWLILGALYYLSGPFIGFKQRRKELAGQADSGYQDPLELSFSDSPVDEKKSDD
ncbi:MAG: CDP-diacylglycerol--serine O-phosphatidyltransferase [Candidatus Hydrogenedentes bacterium CG07_land_8_20_14_0_80_42_17]|nr:MAG: CDP-diacylglycerol--serine O-phosphatidyltransferase [Candidatus Hydrogenedentes bacterium CG07_land_8_20_14_0_80_42_17]